MYKIRLVFKSISSLKRIVSVLLFLIILYLFIPSCIKKDDFDFKKLTLSDWSPNIAAPLISSKLTLTNILSSNQLILEGTDHSLYLIYRTSVFSKRADELINIQDQFVSTNHSFSTGGIIIGNSAVTNHFSNFTFTTSNNERFDNVYLKNANINFSINADINHDAKMKVSIPGATLNGVPFEKIINYTYLGSLPVIVNQNFNISGYKLVFLPGNQMAVNYEITVYGEGYVDNSPYTINFNESITGIQFDKMFGYFGKISFAFDQGSISLDLFHNNVSGSITFDDPRLNIYANTFVGMPIDIIFDSLRAISDINAPYIVDVTIPTQYIPWQITPPSFAQFGQTIESTFQLNKTNSNFRDAINMSPQYFSFLANAQTNPAGNSLIDTNFVFDSSRVTLGVELELPLQGSAWDFILQDTIDFDIGSIVNKLEWVLFKIQTINGFPLDAEVQVYFADTLYNILDSLIVPFEKVIASGLVGPSPNYMVISPTIKSTMVFIVQERLINLVDAKKLIIKSRLATTNNGATVVKFYSTYNIEVKMGVQVKTKSLNN